MGEVYRARDTKLGRDVALKILPEAFARDPDRLARFEREARMVAGLNHPNIVVLHSIEEIDGVRFLTMELVEGEGLDRQIVSAGLPVARVVDIGLGLAEALAAAHERRVVHRDLKPGNIMVTRDGRVKVLDFGLAKSEPGGRQPQDDLTTAVGATEAGQVVGTVPYMAPEQVRGDVVDSRTDVFALGIVLFELISGRRPFAGATSADLMSAILRDAPPSLAMLRPEVPPEIARLVARCLEKDPERRPQTAKDVRNELDLARRALESGASRAPQSAAGPSIAVMPFANQGRGEDDEYFADGITEDVIAQLCKVRTLKVISRSSVMSLKDRPLTVQEIASSLNVATVLEGSVRRHGDRVRIVARLTDAASGTHLWAETFDRQLTDIFAIQSDVALQIASALRAELAPKEDERIRRRPTHDLEAYELYLRGRHSLSRYTTEEYFRSIDYFERTIARDPGFALAYVGLATALTELTDNGRMDRGQVGVRAIAAAARAVSIEPDLGDAHCAQAYARMVFEFDWAGAEQGYKRAIELSPGNAEAYDLYGRLCGGMARFDEALALHERAYDLDPFTCLADLATSQLRAGRNEAAERQALAGLEREPRSARLHATLGWAIFRQGRIDEGLAKLEAAVSLAPGDSAWMAQRGQALALAGRTDEARAILRQLEDPERPIAASPYHLAYVYTGLGESDRAIDCLERAFAGGSGPLYGLKGSFLLTPLRDHPRFASLLKKLGVP
jgi:serine/threonine protein kinase/tetratricopeptide (TPR) repeat protein